MVRKPQDHEAMQTVAVRMPGTMIAEIDAYRARLKAENPAFRVERGEAMRDLLLKALAMVGDSGPIAAPVPTGKDRGADHAPIGADQSADHTPSLADQSLHKAARERTTVRQGRKRQAAAAKG